MRPFIREVGLVAPLDRVDVDTDQIVPKQFLKRVERTGYGEVLFHDWRYPDDGEPDPDFVLNRPEYDGASILAAGRNFGCGSSREHAPWALKDFGFRAILAPSFADIFESNCFQNGLLPVTLPAAVVDRIISRAAAGDGYRATVDLERREVRDGEGLRAPFRVPDHRRRALMEGLDPIALTLRHEEAIRAYEARREGPNRAFRSGEDG